MSKPKNAARKDFMTVDWLIERLYANRLTGAEEINFNGPDGDLGWVLSFYYSEKGDSLEIDIGHGD